MRSRNIKPGFFDNEILGSIDPLAQILFAGLWCLSDREGRLEDRPARIKAQIFPYRQANIDKLLALLAQSGFIIRYEIEGQKFICIPKFKEHQNPHPHEAKSKLPDISMSLHVITCNVMSVKCNADSLIPDSLIPDSKSSEVNDESCPPPSPPKVKAKRLPIGSHQTFIAWWCFAYGEKYGKPYVFSSGKDGKHVKDILASLPLDVAILTACSFLCDNDPFYGDKRDIGMFRSAINKFHPPEARVKKQLEAEGIIPVEWNSVGEWLAEKEAVNA